jgi:hypothetical protein
MHSCQLCQAQAVVDLLDFGPQPVTSRFVCASEDDEQLFGMVLAQCEECGLVQLRQGPSCHDLVPRFAWIAYNEPEGHLDDLADAIAGLPGLSRDASVWGLSFQDDSLLRRLRERGFANQFRPDPGEDLGIGIPLAAVETIQDRVTSARAAALVAVHGRPQLLIARRILEHAHRLSEFLTALCALLSPGGYLVLEVPDCLPAFLHCDYTTVWEEHTLYFTPSTFSAVFPRMGMDMVWQQVYPMRLENSLVGIGRAGRDRQAVSPAPADCREDKAVTEVFSRRFDPLRRQARARLAQRQSDHGAIAVLGAGHQACAFVNFFGIADLLTCVIDNNTDKQGLRMPGSRLPIRGPEAFVNDDIRLCLLSINPDIEERVMQRNQEFVARGGQFLSMYAASGRSLIHPEQL